MNGSRFVKFVESGYDDVVRAATVSYLERTRCFFEHLTNYGDYSHFDLIALRYGKAWVFCPDPARPYVRWELKVSVDILCALSDLDGEFTQPVKNIRLLIAMDGNLDRMLEDARILGVRLCDDEAEAALSDMPNRMDDNLVPVIPRSEYESLASGILRRYCSEALDGNGPVDVERLAAQCGLSCMERTITCDGSVLGRIYMDGKNDYLYNPEKHRREKVAVAGNTLIVDPIAAEKLSPYSRNVTYVHEILHALLHRNSYLFKKCCMKKAPGVYQKSADEGCAGSPDFTEIQANGLTPYIIIPYETIDSKLNEYWKKSAEHAHGKTERCVWTLRAMSDFYMTPVNVVKKRLHSLGYAVDGLDTWVDGHRVRDYLYRRGALRENETYTISYLSCTTDIYVSEFLSRAINEGRYVFAENHLCRNDPKYIKRGAGDALMLTDYALSHMDECCVRFADAEGGDGPDGADREFVCYTGIGRNDTPDAGGFRAEGFGSGTAEDETKK